MKWLSRNPKVLGRDVIDVAWLGLGVGLAGAVNDKIIAPLVARVVPQSLASEAMGKVLDAVTTVAAAWGIGEVARLVYRPAVAPLVTGGVALAVGKGISIAVPGYALSGTLPGSVLRYIPSLALPAASAPPSAGQLNAGNGATPALVAIGVGTTGL